MCANASAYVHVCAYVCWAALPQQARLHVQRSTDSTAVFVRGDIAVVRLDGRTGEQAAREEGQRVSGVLVRLSTGHVRAGPLMETAGPLKRVDLLSRT